MKKGEAGHIKPRASLQPHQPHPKYRDFDHFVSNINIIVRREKLDGVCKGALLPYPLHRSTTIHLACAWVTVKRGFARVWGRN
jgi:hypothetical protein